MNTNIKQSGKRINPLKYDPSRTGSMQRGQVTKVRRAFKALRAKVVRFVRDEDAFGLKEPPRLIVGNAGAFKFKTDPNKIKEFKAWLQTQIDETLLSKSEEEQWEAYIEAAFKKGAARSFDDTNKAAKASTGAEFYEGGKEMFLRESFGKPASVQKVKMLAARTFDDIKNLTEDMATKMGRTLVEGLISGLGSEELAQQLAESISIALPRAETIARTEVMRAHSEGQLQALEELGLGEVGVEVEWSTAGVFCRTKKDRKIGGCVCPQCEPMEGKIFKIADAHGMIPKHPNCRCVFIPRIEGALMEKQATKKNATRNQYVPLSPALYKHIAVVENVFCATGAGGGKDPTCSPKGGKGEKTKGVLASMWEKLKSVFSGPKAAPSSSVNPVKAESNVYHVTQARKKLESAGVKDMWDTNLTSSKNLRHLAVTQPLKFDSTINGIETSLRSALKFGASAKQQGAINEKLSQLAELKRQVNDFRKGKQPEYAKPKHDEVLVYEKYGKRGQGPKTIASAVEHMSKGNNVHATAEHLRKEYGIALSTARRYVRAAVKQAKSHVDDKVKSLKTKKKAA